MSWQAKIVTFVRGIIDDLSQTPTHSDEKLEQLIVIAGSLVTTEVELPTDYSIDVETVEINPDPSSDTLFINLVGMKTACMIARAEQRISARSAHSIKDGPSNIDGRAPAEQTTKWADTICGNYSQFLLDYRLGNLILGQAIVGPYGNVDGLGHSTAPLYDNRGHHSFDSPFN
jgi:hypothetical protein